MVHGKVIGSLLVVCLVAMLAEQTEGFFSFFSPSDMRRMMEKEKSKTGKKSVRSGETESGELAAPERYMEEEAARLGSPLEIGVRLSPRQFDKYGAALGEVLNEMLEEGGKDDDVLRRELKSFGFCPGPISDSTRKLYLSKLKKLGSENCSKSRFARTLRSLKHGLSSSSSSNIASSPQNQTQHSHRHDSLRLRENSASASHRYRTPSFNQQDSDESDDYEAYSHYCPPAAHANFTSYTKEDLQKRCDSTVKQNVFLDRQLSRALFTCTLVLSAVLIWLVYVKTVGLGQNEDVKDNLKMLPVDCKGKTDTYCRAEEHKVHMQLLSELYSFLAKVAGDFECGNPSELKSKCVSVDDAKSYLAILNRGYTDRFEAALQMIIQSRRDLGIRVVEPDHAPGAVRCLESSRPQMGLVCRFSRAVFTVMSRMFIFVLALGVLWGVLILLRYRWMRLQEEEQAMYELVKRIIGEVRDHYKDWDQGLEPIPYVPIPHVRDSLIPPQNRQVTPAQPKRSVAESEQRPPHAGPALRRMRRIWDRAVEFLSSNESRIRTETHRISGEDFLVWRWTQPVELSDSS
ncbi:UNVERIFIED_CONTAM: hypothetical protein FKN15_072810 [Acipenser sinensis]